MNQTVARIEELIPAAVAEILETMFFAEVQPAEVLTWDCGSTLLEVRVGFEGVPAGELGLTLAESTAAALAADFLGVDRDELTRDQARQMAGELGNMICGGVVSRIESDRTFQLHAPRVGEPGADPLPSGTQYLLTDAGLIGVWCKLAGEWL